MPSQGGACRRSAKIFHRSSSIPPNRLQGKLLQLAVFIRFEGALLNCLILPFAAHEEANAYYAH